MIKHTDINDQEVYISIKNRTIYFGGNKNLKIYGILKCKSGKRINRKNRVLFTSEQEAIYCGYRPCGHCMRQAYYKWKNLT